MKKSIIISFMTAIGAVVCLAYSSFTASATSVDDVIAHARAAGMPEEQIQNCISMYGREDWTSEQCDKAIAELESMGFTKPFRPVSSETSETKIKPQDPVSIDKLKELDPEQQAEVISGILEIGKDFDYNFLIEDISDDSITISTRDGNNKLIGVTVLGNSIEKTGITYTFPVLTAVALALLSAAGMVIIVRRTQ